MKEVNEIINIIQTVKNNELIITITTYKRHYELNKYIDLLLNQTYNEKYHINIVKHREAMAKSVGIKIGQYDLNSILISTFISYADASRQTGVSSSTIKKCVKDNKSNRDFIWKKE